MIFLHNQLIQSSCTAVLGELNDSRFKCYCISPTANLDIKRVVYLHIPKCYSLIKVWKLFLYSSCTLLYWRNNQPLLIYYLLLHSAWARIHGAASAKIYPTPTPTDTMIYKYTYNHICDIWVTWLSICRRFFSSTGGNDSGT